MNKLTITLLVLGCCLPLFGYIAYNWFKIFNSPDGERYMKRRAQGHSSRSAPRKSRRTTVAEAKPGRRQLAIVLMDSMT